MTPDEAIAKQLVPFADAVGKYLDGAWEPESTLTPEKVGQAGVPCTLQDGEPGRTYAVTWSGPATSDLDGTITKVQAAWKELGVDVEIVNPHDSALGDARVLSYPAYHSGTTADGYLLTLTLTTKISQLEAQTHCLGGEKG